jgi:hypothetical protein
LAKVPPRREHSRAATVNKTAARPFDSEFNGIKVT